MLARRVPSNFGGNQGWLGENPPLFLRQTGRRDKGETFVPCDGQKARELFNIFAKRFSFARGLTTRRFSARYSRFPGFRLFPLSLSRFAVVRNFNNRDGRFHRGDYSSRPGHETRTDNYPGIKNSKISPL